MGSSTLVNTIGIVAVARLAASAGVGLCRNDHRYLTADQVGR